VSATPPRRDVGGALPPDVVKWACVHDLIEPSKADRYLRDRQPPDPWIRPATPPPPERIVPVRAIGRRKFVRHRMTSQLVAARVLVPSVAHGPAESENP